MCFIMLLGERCDFGNLLQQSVTTRAAPSLSVLVDPATNVTLVSNTYDVTGRR